MHAGKSITADKISTAKDDKYLYPCIGGNGIRGYTLTYNTEGSFPIIGRQGALCGNINYAEGMFYATEHAVVVDTFCDTDTKWAYYFLTQLDLNQYATATAQPGLSVKTISDVQIPVPPKEEQKRIVTKIEKWFALIDVLEQNTIDLRETVKQVKTKILDLAIHGKLVPQDATDEPAIELLKCIMPNYKSCDTSHYGNLPCEIPKSWAWVKMKDIAVSELGKTLDRGKNTGKPYDYLCALNVKWGTFDFTTLKQILLEDYEKERYLVRKGDLLICEGGDVGRAAIWESDREIYYQNALHRVRFKGNINQYFYLYILQYYKWLGLIDDVSGGVTIKHFTQNSMQKLLFPMPPVAEQKRIVQRINDIFSILDAITTEL